MNEVTNMETEQTSDTDILSALEDEKLAKKLEKKAKKEEKKRLKEEQKRAKKAKNKGENSAAEETTEANEQPKEDENSAGSEETAETTATSEATVETGETAENSDQSKSVQSEAEAKEKKSRKRDKKADKKPVDPKEINIVKELLSLILYIGFVAFLCFFIITFVGCRSRVDGSSMMPTLADNDNLWVDKLTYTFGEPQRFDVIIFNYDEETTYVKRVIGLPGETVQIDVNGNIYINNEVLEENYGREVILSANIGRASQPILLGENEYFVLGDNRNNSSDSRWSDVGNVHKDDIVGKVIVRIYPFSKFGIIK